MVYLLSDACVLGQGCVELDHDSVKTILKEDNSLADVSLFANCRKVMTFR